MKTSSVDQWLEYFVQGLLVALLSIGVGWLFCCNAQAAPGDVSQDARGITLETSGGLTRVEIWGDRIARVLHTPTTTLPTINSLAVTGSAATVSWQLQNSGTYLLLTAPNFTVRVESPSGRVRFFDTGGATVLAETTSGTTLTGTSVGSPSVASYVVTQKFDLASGEAIYGLGQHQAGVMNYVGQNAVTLLQRNMEIGVPVWLSNKGYAVLWDDPAVTTIDVGKTTAGRMSWSSEAGDAVNYYFCYGPEPDQAIAGYRALTGAAPMLGKWAWGYWQSKERYQSQQELLDVAAQYRALGIPIDGIIQDWRYWPDSYDPNTQKGGWGSHDFDSTRYPDPAGLMSTLHGQNIHSLISVWAKFDVTSSGTSIPNLQALEAVNGAYSQVIPYVYPAGQGKWYDPFQPAARQVYWNKISQKIFGFGWDGWWLDASEPELSGNWGEFRNFNTALGPGAKVFNAYPLLHTSAVYAGQRAETSQKRAIILTRSAYAGQQRNAAISWSGDINGTWSVFANQIPAGLNFVSSGIPYWNTDIGGFGSSNPSTAAYAELFTRWFQYGTFCPMFRVHGTNYPKEVWRFPSATQPTLINYINLRYRLLPYIYSTAWKVTNEGYTMMRPLVMDFRSDSNVNGIGNQFMFGPALLVNPVTTAGATTRSVYLPSGGDWYDFWNGIKVAGGQTISADAPIEKIPLFVKAGSIVPCGPYIQYATQSSDPIELRVYPGANGSFTLYEDEGDNYNYESGVRATIPFSWDESARQLTIGQRTGSFPGMLVNRTFRVVFVSPAHGVGLSDGATPDGVVSYNGSPVVVQQQLPSLPSVPTGVTAVSGGTGITVSWTGPSEGFAYRIQRSLQSGGPYTTVAAAVTGTTWVDTGVEPGTAYFYVVNAMNAAGEGTASGQVSVTHAGSGLRTLLMFNEVSGTNAADGSGKGVHSTLVNGPVRVAGKGGNAVDLNGSNQYANIPAAPMSVLNNFTIAAWVNLDTVAQGARIFDFGSGTNSYIYLTPKSASNTARFGITTSGSAGEQQVNGAAALPTGAWTHIAVTLSGTTGALYINGVASGSSNLTLSPQSLGATTQNWIGRSQSSANYLDGRVDDFRIYSGALSAAEIQTLASGSAGALLTPWTAWDVGSPTIPGSSGCGVSGSNSVHVTASGSDIQGTSDQFRFVSVTRTGTTDFIARVDAMDTSDPWAKAGLMIRSGTGAADANCLVAVTPQNGVGFQYRTSSGGSTTFTQVPGYAAPRWLKISRAGSIFTAYHSGDGVSWSQVGNSITLSALPATAYYGIALTAHTNTAPVGASFSSISIQDPPPPIPVTASLTAPGTDLDDRYFFASNLNDADNIGGSGISNSGANDEDTYVASDRSSKGQTFTTGNNPYGYTIAGFTFQHILWPQYLTNGSFYDVQPGDLFKFQFGLMSGSTKTPILTGVAQFSGSTITGAGTNGTGKYLTFDLSGAATGTLWPNTTYYFEITSATGAPYFELNGSRANVYAGATAFRGNAGTDDGSIASGVNLLTGERIFHANLTKVAGPSYASWIAGYPGVGSQNGVDDDPDGDGMTNDEEYIAGTDPSDRASVIKVSQMTPNGNDLIISFPTSAGKLYRLERSDTLGSGSWLTVVQNIEGTGGAMNVTDPNGAAQPKRFYRVVVEP